MRLMQILPNPYSFHLQLHYSLLDYRIYVIVYSDPETSVILISKLWSRPMQKQAFRDIGQVTD